MKVRTGQEVVVTADTDALTIYGAARAAGRRGILMGEEPIRMSGGLGYYGVQIGGYVGAFEIREDHFVAWTPGYTAPADNEDLRWRRAADRWFGRIAKAKADQG